MIRKMILSLVVLFISCAACFAAAYEDGIAVVVNYDVITVSELNAEVEGLFKRIGAPPEADKETLLPELRKSAADRLITDLLVTQQASRLGIVITEENVNTTVEGMLKERNIPMKAFLETLARDGGTLDEYKKEVRQYLTRMKLISKEIRPKISVSDEEIGNYYREHRNLYEGKEAVRLSQILFIVPEGADAASRAQIKARAEEARAKLAAGDSFELMANQVSEDPAARAGGDMGFVERNMMIPAIDEAAFTLSPGQMSGVIETPVGYHIIKVTEKRGAGLKPVEEVRAEIVEKIASGKMEAKFQEWTAEVREKAHIEIRIDNAAS